MAKLEEKEQLPSFEAFMLIVVTLLLIGITILGGIQMANSETDCDDVRTRTARLDRGCAVK